MEPLGSSFGGDIVLIAGVRIGFEVGMLWIKVNISGEVEELCL